MLVKFDNEEEPLFDAQDVFRYLEILDTLYKDASKVLIMKNRMTILYIKTSDHEQTNVQLTEVLGFGLSGPFDAPVSRLLKVISAHTILEMESKRCSIAQMDNRQSIRPPVR